MGANHADRLRPWLEVHPVGLIGDIYNAWLDRLSIRAVCRALEAQQAAGRLIVTDKAYAYKSDQRADVQARVWAVVRGLATARGLASPAEVARLAEATQDYTTRYLRWLADQGHLIRREAGYTLAASAPLEAPHWNRRKEERR